MAEDSFVRRWSQRKLAAREEDERDSSPVEEAPAAPPALPPIDELTAESDYTPFLAREVPAELRRMALRKLWRSDPVLANLDGLNDYDGDFRKLGVGKLVQTAYRIGKRLAAEADKPEETEEPGEESETGEPDRK